MSGSLTSLMAGSVSSMRQTRAAAAGASGSKESRWVMLAPATRVVFSTVPAKVRGALASWGEKRGGRRTGSRPAQISVSRAGG